MKRAFASMLGLLLFAAPAGLWAKGATTRITITGGDLVTAIEITDATTIRPFQVWAGAGTQTCIRRVCTEHTTGFIVDWPSGVVTERPGGLPRYTVAFHTASTEGLIDARGLSRRDDPTYVVLYEFDLATRMGYVYLPGGGNGDEWAAVNAAAIYRGVEGNWLRASSEWDNVAGPLVTRK